MHNVSRRDEPAIVNRTDVIVVGGGIAGLVAAREVRFAGLRCTVVEARDRIGGRIWTREHFGKPRDVGATFVHWAQPHVWAEITRYGLAVGARPSIDVTVALAGGVRIQGDLASLWNLIGPGMDAFCADCRRFFPQPYSRVDTPELVAADRKSMADRIEDLDVSEETRMLVDGFWTVNCNRPTREGALTHALHWVAATGGDWRVFNEACARYKLTQGLGSLTKAVYSHGSPALMLGEPVRLVERTDREVVVVTESGSEVRGRACILALPLNVLAGLQLRPELSASKRALLSEGVPAGGFKLWARTDRPLSASYLCMSAGSAPLTFARTEDTVGSGTVLGFYGPEKNAVELDSVGAVEELVRRWIPDAKLAEVWSHDWHDDEFSRQTWRVARPGQLTSYGDEMTQPEGNIMLAGADVATGPWNGFVDGAIESGLTAARQVVSALTGPMIPLDASDVPTPGRV
jgi:monoamine oxidase